MWSCAVPESWPEPPTEITATSAATAEACPRRWALSAAHYPELWPRHGYPPRVQVAGLGGTVVHRAVEILARELARADCQSISDPAASGVLRGLGGWTQIVNGAIDELVASLAGNPRATSVLEGAARVLRAQVPEYRLRVQDLLSRVRFRSSGSGSGLRQASAFPERSPLSTGTYVEVDVRASRIGWRGRIDLLSVTDSDCEITDFKSGEYSDLHDAQILTYACLWSLDDELNPSGRLATRLVLRYPARDIEVPVPSSGELHRLEKELVARRADLRAALSQRPPHARPSVTNCMYCGVRHLCDAFWSAGVQRAFGDLSSDSCFVDVEVTVDSRHGPTSWDVTVQSELPRLAGKPGVLRAADDLHLPIGACIRLLGASVTQDPNEAQPILLSVGILSEVFLVEP